jgi:hypothetical protein
MNWAENGTGHLRMNTWIYLNDVRMNWSDSKELQVCLCMRSKAIKKYRLFSRNFAKLDSRNIYCFKTFNPIHKPRYLLRWLGGHWALWAGFLHVNTHSVQLELKTIELSYLQPITGWTHRPIRQAIQHIGLYKKYIWNSLLCMNGVLIDTQPAGKTNITLLPPSVKTVNSKNIYFQF